MDSVLINEKARQNRICWAFSFIKDLINTSFQLADGVLGLVNMLKVKKNLVNYLLIKKYILLIYKEIYL
jgi:hypothetical protein